MEVVHLGSRVGDFGPIFVFGYLVISPSLDQNGCLLIQSSQRELVRVRSFLTVFSLLCRSRLVAVRPQPRRAQGCRFGLRLVPQCSLVTRPTKRGHPAVFVRLSREKPRNSKGSLRLARSRSPPRPPPRRSRWRRSGGFPGRSRPTLRRRSRSGA